MIDTTLDSARPKTVKPPAAGSLRRRPVFLQRAALALADSLVAWAGTPSQRAHPAAASRKSLNSRAHRMPVAEGRREAALSQRLLMPRQF